MIQIQQQKELLARRKRLKERIGLSLLVVLSLSILLLIVNGIRSALPEEEPPVQAAIRKDREKQQASAQRSKVEDAVIAMQAANIIYEIDTRQKIVRVNRMGWMASDVGNKQYLVNLLGDYMNLKTGAGNVTVMSDANDRILARRGVFGGVTINE